MKKTTQIWSDKPFSPHLEILHHKTPSSRVPFSSFITSVIQKCHQWDTSWGWSSMAIILPLISNVFISFNLVASPRISTHSISLATRDSKYQTQTLNTPWHTALRRFDFLTNPQLAVLIFNFRYNDNIAYVICTEFFLDYKFKKITTTTKPNLTQRWNCVKPISEVRHCGHRN